MLPAMCVLIHVSTVSQESPGVLHTSYQVPPPQDCCAFQLVPMCTVKESSDRHQASAMHITCVYDGIFAYTTFCTLIKNHMISILYVICKFVIQNIHILLLMHLSLTMLDSFTKTVRLINAI